MRVHYRLEALEDLHGQLSYISEDNPHAAEQVGATIRRTIDRLSVFPYSGREGVVPGTYELVIPQLPYIVVYRIQPSFVEIISIFHTSTSTPRR